MSPLFPHAAIPGALGWESFTGFLVVGILAAVVQWCLFRHDAFLKSCILRIDHFILTSLFGEGSMVLMSMVMLILWLQHRIYMMHNLRSRRISFLCFIHHDITVTDLDAGKVQKVQAPVIKFTIKSGTQKYQIQTNSDPRFVSPRKLGPL